MTVSYSVTDITPDDDITAETVSVLIVDKDGNLRYYSPMTGSFAMTGGSGTFELPAGYAYTDSVYLLAEDINSQYLTDYASEKAEIRIPSVYRLAVTDGI